MIPLRILVVEDEALVSRDLQATLQKLGYEVPVVARTGQEALEVVRSQPISLVLMDIRLGEGWDGIETAQVLQQECNVPVVYLTAYADEATIQRARETQPYGYLLKPFHESELRSVVELAAARHQANQRIAASEAHFINTLRSMAEGVISTDLLGRINFMNPVAEHLTGWSAVEAQGRPLHEVFRIASPTGQSLEPLGLTGGNGTRSIILTPREGLPVLIEDNTAPIRDGEGGLAGIVVLFRRKEPKAALAEATGSEGAAPWPNLAGIVESIVDPLVALDAEWRMTYLNPQAAQVLDGRRESLLGTNLWDCLPASMFRLYYHEFSQSLKWKKSRSFEMENEARKQWYEIQLYPFGDGLLALMRDITDRRAAEERERKLEKLESLGLLARGFAHDFNNLLTVMLGNLSLAEMLQPEDVPGRNEIITARQATLQAQGLVQHLLTFARGGAPIKQPTDLGRLVREWFLEWPKRSPIDYRLEISSQLLQAEVDRQQFLRLLHNLLRNAEQSVERSGVITVRLGPAAEGVHHLPERAMPGGADPENWLLLQVIDDGEGIAEPHLQRVFEPYFTTREEANASGLGLTVCESIAKAHGASLFLASRRGEGTTVTLCLPAFQAPEEGIRPTASETRPPSKRRILILEDEPLIRQLIVANLTAAGCSVDQTADGAETVRHYQEALERGDPYDLLVMDLSIPNGMGGAQAMERIRELDPTVKAVVSSGYSDDPIMSRYMDYGFRAVLPKPYQPRDLRELVESLLAEG